MKTAQEWIKDALDYSKLEIPLCEDLSPTLVSQIQLDAFKAGAEWAAQFCEDQTFANGVDERSYDHACNDCQQSILSAASNLKELPK
jgi:xylose isomerase